MTYAEAIRFLYDLRLFGAKFGLENTRKLAGLVGNPQDKLRFIHVAGTNGKGSTCALLESIYRAAGLRVGLFTSPHLVSFRERIQVNRQLISEGEVVRLVEQMRDLFDEFSSDQPPTFFEAITVMALRHFADHGCDLVIWETGLGGRLDATNIVTPLASVITNIGLDHQQWLGDTLEKIAAEKAGIIKPNIPVLTAAKEPSALAVIEQIAREKNAPLTKVEKFTGVPSVSLLGDHQKLNAAVAIATVEVLQKQIPIKPEAIQKGLATAHWPGRLQLLARPTGQKILLDGAHNVDGAKTLVTALKQLFPAQKPTLILGMLQDKDWLNMCEILLPVADKVLFVPVQSERTSAPHELAETCRRVYSGAQIMEHTSLAAALEAVANEPLVVIAGSLYLVGEALELLEPQAQANSERELNEWTTAALAKPDK
ncbi:MAG TPA: folylpolyglutamate synthase/dihydrofolate synthase family protein [Verrucomicrobiae bacterium]|nr:folylpolyglutamate synthase/dihydrofolate synthase family protein [Verrucomicrobiae bacterium]